MNFEDQKILKDILSQSGGIRLDRMFEDCVELVEKFNMRKIDILLQDEIEDTVHVVEEGRSGRKGKKKIRKSLGKN